MQDYTVNNNIFTHLYYFIASLAMNFEGYIKDCRINYQISGSIYS